MIPEITITCSTGKVFINNITVEQYKKYAALMEKNGSDKITDALFFNKRIIQEIFGNRMSLDELGEVDVIEFLTASKGIHFIMQDIVSDAWERSERSSRVTIELSLLLSGISVAFAIFFGISNKKRNDKKDAEQETEERATANTLMMTKLENIADDVKDIKRDYKETRAEVQDLHDRVLIVEQSLKSYHKRLDGMNLNIKTDQ